jgi:hypothetical protein
MQIYFVFTNSKSRKRQIHEVRALQELNWWRNVYSKGKNINSMMVITCVCSSQPLELKLELGVKLPGTEHTQRHPCAAPEQMARSIIQLYFSVVLVQGVGTNFNGSCENSNFTPTWIYFYSVHYDSPKLCLLLLLNLMNSTVALTNTKYHQ